MAGMEGMQTAAGIFNQATGETGTVRGAIFAGKIMNDSKLKNLSSDTQIVLSQMPSDQITSSSPIVQRAAEELNIKDPEEVVQRIKGIKGDSFLMRKKSEDTRQALKKEYETLKSQGIPEDQINAYLTKTSDFNKLITEMAAESSSVARTSPQAQRSLAMKLVKGELSASELEADAEAGVGKPSGRMEDESIAAIATQQGIINKKFLEMAPAMENAAIAAQKMTDRVLEMQMKFQAVIEKGDKISPETLKDILQMPVSNTKPVVGKSK
jgi:hypothetical protein